MANKCFYIFSEMRCGVAAVTLPSRDKSAKSEMEAQNYGVGRLSTGARFMLLQKDPGTT